MIIFWLICAIFVLIALAFTLPPLLQTDNKATQDVSDSREANITIYKDQLSELDADLRNGIIGSEQFELDRLEIQRRLLDDVAAKEVKSLSANPSGDKRVAYVLAIAIPVLAVALYLRIGNTNARPATPDSIQSAAGQNAGLMSQSQIEANVAALAKRLQENPSDVQGWTMLARSYSILERYDESSKAYEKAVALKPRDAELITNYAFTLAMANQGNFKGRPQELVKQALQIDPENANALGLAGGAAFAQKDYKQAIAHWNKLLALVPPESEMAQAVNEKLSEAKSLASRSQESGP